jgi:hypothetical protein
LGCEVEVLVEVWVLGGGVGCGVRQKFSVAKDLGGQARLEALQALKPFLQAGVERIA